MRVRIGFIQIGEPNGWTIDEFNKGKKAKALPKSPPKGKRPPPKLKSAGGPPKGKSPPKKSPKKPKKPSYHSPGNFIIKRISFQMNENQRNNANFQPSKMKLI